MRARHPRARSAARVTPRSIRAPTEVRAESTVFQPQAPALAALTRRVKEAFDPKGILNPGRMYRGV